MRDSSRRCSYPPGFTPVSRAPQGRIGLRLALCAALFISTAVAENQLTIEGVSDEKCRVVLDLGEPAGALQFTLLASAGAALNGVEAGQSIAGPGWIVAWNAISDREVRVVIMGRKAGTFTAGRYELLSWTMGSADGQATVAWADVVLADDLGKSLPIAATGFEWYRSLPQFSLLGNYPNPFNPSTVISFSLERRADVSLEVYDIVGRRLEVVFDRTMEGGTHQVPWTTAGKRLASGVYFIRLMVDGRSAVGKMNVVQ